MEAAVLITTGFIIACIARWTTQAWQSAREARRFANARELLKAHKMESFAYLPSVGVVSPQVRDALDVVAQSGRIVLDEGGQLVGNVLPTGGKRALVRLVAEQKN